MTVNNVDPINLGAPTSSIQIPALKYKSGDRVWYAATIPFKTLGKFIQTSAVKKKNKEIIKSDIKNRFLDRKHKNEIVDYLKSEPEFTLPPITLVSYDELDFRAYSYDGNVVDEEQVLESNGSVAGVILLPIDYEFECLDGNHRTAAIRDLANEEPEYIAGSSMLINIVHEKRGKKIRQDFVDVNKNAKQTTSSINTLFNTREPLSNLVVDLIDEIPYLKETTELLSTSVAKNSKDIYTINNIKNAITEIMGYNSQSVKAEKVSFKLKEDQDFTKETEKNVRVFFNALKNNENIKACIEKPEKTPDIRAQSIITTGTGIIVASRVAGYIFSTYSNSVEQKNEVEKLMNIDWSRSNPMFEGKVVVNGQKILNSRDSITAATVTIKSKLGYQLTESEYNYV